MKNLSVQCSALLVVVLLLGCASFAADKDVALMTKEELRGQMQNPEVMIIDVRTGRDWSGSDQKIVGALRADPKDQDSWPKETFKDKTLVLYCA